MCISDCLAFTSLTAVISILNQVTVRLSVKCGDKTASVDVYIKRSNVKTTNCCQLVTAPNNTS